MRSDKFIFSLMCNFFSDFDKTTALARVAATAILPHQNICHTEHEKNKNELLKLIYIVCNESDEGVYKHVGLAELKNSVKVAMLSFNKISRLVEFGKKDPRKVVK